MSLYVISDLHLAFGIDKPMDIFGGEWIDYMKKIEENWLATVKDGDIVVMPGDFSWATYLSEAEMDFRFIENLPGKKILSKGNHDYWWTTMNKLNEFLINGNYKTISFMHNNSYSFDGYVVVGTRGWKLPTEDNFSSEDQKIFNREVQRLELSIKNAKINPGDKIIATLHYPPFDSSKNPSKLVEIMKEYNVNTCVYGHLHGMGLKNGFEGTYDGIDFKIISADYLKFKPYKLV